MKKLIAILAIVALCSCVEHKIKVIDGCQYIETTTYDGNSIRSYLIHKEDCNNPIHKQPAGGHAIVVPSDNY